MTTDIIVRFGFTILLWFSTVIVTFSIFKIPIKMYHQRIAILTLSLGATNYYLKDVAQSPIFPIQVLLLFVILLLMLNRYPIMYAFIVCTTGFVISVFVEAILTLSSVQLNLSTFELMANSRTHYIFFHAVESSVFLLMAFICKRFNIGFSLIIKRFSGKYSLNSYNFIWAAFLLLSISFIQFSWFKMTILSLHGYIILGMSLFLLLCLGYSYRQNKKALMSRYRSEAKK